MRIPGYLSSQLTSEKQQEKVTRCAAPHPYQTMPPPLPARYGRPRVDIKVLAKKPPVRWRKRSRALKSWHENGKRTLWIKVSDRRRKRRDAMVSVRLEALRIITIAVWQVRAQLGQRLATKRNYLSAIIDADNLIKLRQIEINETGAVGETIVR